MGIYGGEQVECKLRLLSESLAKTYSGRGGSEAHNSADGGHLHCIAKAAV